MDTDSVSSVEPMEAYEASDESVEVSSGKTVDSRSCPAGGGLPKRVICYRRRDKGERDESSKRVKVNDVVADTDSVCDYHLDDLRNRRAKQLKRLLNELTPEQREDVKCIGFGGVLDFNCDLLPDQMNAWLLSPKQFNPVTRFFSVSGKIKFALTAADAERIFGLNSRGTTVVSGALYEAPVKALFKEWKRRYKMLFGQDITLKMMKSLIRRLGSGGDDFKRFFVLFVMKTLLAPDAGVDIYLGLVRSLVDVEGIKHMNWADYVVDQLCSSVYYYYRWPSARGCEGCLLLLQLTYFHNTIWPGIPLPQQEPLIKHWGGTKLGERVLEERRAGGFGQLLFLKKNLSDLRLVQDGFGSSGRSPGRQIAPSEPLTVWSDDQIFDAIPEVNSNSSDLRGSPWVKWVFNYPATYASALVMKCTTFCNYFPQYKLEFADFCVSDGDPCDPIFDDGNNISLSRVDFMSLDRNVPVSSSIVNAFSLVLNNDLLKKGMSSRVCLGIVSLRNDPATHNVLVGEWKKWLKSSQMKLTGAALVFIPVVCQDSYSLVVVNFMDNKIQCIETERHEGGAGSCARRGRIIGSSFWHLLEVLGDDRIGEYHKFSYEHITPSWSTQGKDPDRAICVMNMMEKFNGSSYSLHNLRLNDEHKKIQLRVAYTCFIGLSTVNKGRTGVLEECATFIVEKGECFRAVA